MNKRVYLFLVLLVSLSILSIGCGALRENQGISSAEDELIEGLTVGETLNEETLTEENLTEEDSKELTISLVGDILLDGSVRGQIDENGYDYPWEHVKKYFQEDDLTIGNLETSITYGGSKWPNKQYNFRSDPENLNAMKNSGVDVVSLANNHSLDYGYDGLLDTLKHIDKSGIYRVGAGENYDDAIKEVIIEKNGYVVGVLGFSRVVPTVEWYPTENRPGVIGAYDHQLEKVLEKVEEVKEKVDILVVSIHWGTELEIKPRDHDLIAGKKLIDAGASIIMGHHPHILQGVEIYKGKPIFYSLGNFVFGSRSELTSNTMIAQVNYSDNKMESLKVIPATIVSGRPVPVSGEERLTKIDYINELSKAWGIEFDPSGIFKMN